MGIGINLKRILAERKMTIKELSKRSGIPINTLYSITKRDSENISSAILTKLANELDVSPFDLTTDTERLSAECNIIEQIQNVYGVDCVKLLMDFIILNDLGKSKAREYVSDLAEQGKYRNN